MTWEEDFERVFGEKPPDWMVGQMGSSLICARPGESLQDFYMRKYGPVVTTELWRSEEELRVREAAGQEIPYWLPGKIERLRGLVDEEFGPAEPQVIVAAGPDIIREAAGAVAVVEVSGMTDLFKPEWEPEVRAGEGLGVLALIAAAALALGG